MAYTKQIHNVKRSAKTKLTNDKISVNIKDALYPLLLLPIATKSPISDVNNGYGIGSSKTT